MRTKMTGVKLSVVASLVLAVVGVDSWAGPTCNGPTPCAALNGAGAFEGRAYFFGSSAYRRYDWNRDVLDDGGSLPIFAWHLPPTFHSGISAALNGAGAFAGYAYFFKGSQYVRYNWRSNRVDYGPASIAAEWHLPESFAGDLDAALSGQGPYAGKAYFFKGGEYARYDWATGEVDFTSNLAAWNLPVDFLSGIDAAINGSGPYAGKAYFFKGNRYVRYDWASGTVDGGVRDIAQQWPALLGLTESPHRRLLLYVTLDTRDQHLIPDQHLPDESLGGHRDNFTRISNVAAQWRPDVITDDFWGPEVVSSMLSDPHTLAMFGAGSFTEWVEAYRNPTWQAQLDTLSALIRETNVPILAVCGSHQLVAYAYGGWSSVGHMANLGESPVPISAEADGIFRAPNPRIGEVGTFGFRPERFEPILTGLPDPMYFGEYHHDQVLESALPSGAVSLLSPNGLIGAQQDSNVPVWHRQIADGAERARVQLLRYDVPPYGRILYTSQFHPDRLDAPGSDVERHGRVFFQNFLDLAAAYWQGVH